MGAVVDRDICTIVETGTAFLVGSGGGQHLRAEGFRELDRGNADAARAALHEKDFPRSEAHALEDIGPHGGEGLRQAGGIDEADILGRGQALHRRNGSVFAIPVCDHQRAEAVTDLPLRNFLARFDHGSRAFEPRDIRCTGRHRIAAHALQTIGAVDPGGGNPDQDFAGFRLGHRPRCRHQHLRSR